MNTEQLFERFRKSARDMGSRRKRVTTEREFGKRLESYSEPGRAYHNLAHIFDVLRVLDNVLCEERSLIEHLPSMVNALIDHDWCMDFHDPTHNEATSSEWSLASHRLLEIDRRYLPRIESGIRVTEHLNPRWTKVQSGDPALIADIDLYILSRSTDRVLEYRSKIRREYAHVPDKEFAANTLTFFARLKNRGFIYRTPFFKRFEKTALERIEDILIDNARLARSG